MKIVFHRTWFVTKYFSWGWYPETWEGWLLCILYAISVGILFFFIPSEYFNGGVIVLTVLLLAICYKKSRKPNPLVDKKEKNWKAGKISL